MQESSNAPAQPRVDAPGSAAGAGPGRVLRPRSRPSSAAGQTAAGKAARAGAQASPAEGSRLDSERALSTMASGMKRHAASEDARAAQGEGGSEVKQVGIGIDWSD